MPHFRLAGRASLALVALLVAAPALASFHLMQIEQVIGGVSGNTNVQAIQLRMRGNGQNLVSQARVRAWDANGANPVLLENMTTNVASGLLGRRVLLGTSEFATHVGAVDFVMDKIPASYLAAGKITFEDDSGNVWWSLAWGASYGGTNTGMTTVSGGNDADGNFGPQFAGPLPSTTTNALRFTGAAGDLSTNNAAQYALTAGAAQFTNNADATGTVGLVPSPTPTPTPSPSLTPTPSLTATATPTPSPTPTITPTVTPGGPVLDVDADGEITPLTDGLLVLRHRFGFSGTSLVASAVDDDCGRCDAAAVDAYLDSLAEELDIDDDGLLQPLTDGLLVLRFLFGFSGPALVTGAVGEGAERDTPEEIAAYLETLN